MTTRTRTPKATQRSIWLDAFLLMLFAAVIGFSVKIVGEYLFGRVKALNPYEARLEDFELSDLAYAHFHTAAVQDTNIFLIDVSSCSRRQITDTLNFIAQLRPKVIGLDVSFPDKSPDTLQQPLREKIYEIQQAAHNVVIAEANGLFDQSFYKALFATPVGKTIRYGYVPAENVLETKRFFEAYPLDENGQQRTSFQVAVLKAFTGERFAELSNEAEEWHLVNYRRSAWRKTDRYQGMPGNPDKIKGKIVLIGSLDTLSLIDRFYTPLNGGIGRSLPDMNGLEYHAQVLSMIIDRDYAHELPLRLAWVIAITYLFCLWFIRLHHHEKLYHYLLDVIILGVVLCTMLIAILLLHFRSLKIEPVDFIIPVFSCGFFLHAYYWFMERKFMLKLFNKNRSHGKH